MAGVTVDVPPGWEETSASQAPAEVVAAASWQSGSDDASTLQVVVGCGPGSNRDLAVAAITEPRPPLEVTDAAEVTEVEVPGADEAIELRFSLGTGPDDTAGLQVAGLYTGVGDTLVLVEISAAQRDTQRELLDATLRSVELDAEALTAACQ